MPENAAETLTTNLDILRAQAAEAVMRVPSIGTLPEITAKIVQAVEDPSCDARSLNRIVQGDPALVTRVLKVVNSAAFGVPRKIESLEQAINLLGVLAVKGLAVGAGLGGMFRGKLVDEWSARDLWKHCLAVAVLARELARKRHGRAFAEEAFMAAMVHDVGLLVSLQLSPERMAGACRLAAGGMNFLEAERQMSGVPHTLLGEALAKRWHFPPSCITVAAFHHDAEAAPEALGPLTAIVQVADAAAAAAEAGFPLTARDSAMPLDLAEVTQEDVGDAVSRLPALLSAVSSLE